MNIILPLAGGVLIGLTAVLMMWAIGRICGISGIISNVMKNLLFERLADSTKQAWRWLFLLGLSIGPIITYAILPTNRPAPIETDWGIVILSGLLVGLGTQIGSGCTSGHGVCGIARLSKRSIVATGTFMLSGIVTVYIVRHIIGGGL